jgi:hypothetical protein
MKCKKHIWERWNVYKILIGNLKVGDHLQNQDGDKVTTVRHHTMKAYWEVMHSSTILDLGTRCRWVTWTEMEDNIKIVKWILKNLDLRTQSGARQGTVTGSCEYCNETSVPKNAKNNLLKNCRPLFSWPSIPTYYEFRRNGSNWDVKMSWVSSLAWCICTCYLTRGNFSWRLYLSTYDNNQLHGPGIARSV